MDPTGQEPCGGRGEDSAYTGPNNFCSSTRVWLVLAEAYVVPAAEEAKGPWGRRWGGLILLDNYAQLQVNVSVLSTFIGRLD